MTATIEVVREIGFPWFDRHATRGGKEIYMYTHYPGGSPCPLHLGGCHWASPAAMFAFYEDNPPPYLHSTFEENYEGYLGCHRFDTWEEAEAWLFAKNKDKET
jgi:hypothetical protein